MKSILQRVISLFCSFAVLICMVVPCVAASNIPSKFNENGKDRVFSEYDYIVAIRKMDERELKNVDLSEKVKQKIRSNEVENEISRRKNLSDEILESQYGYTDKEIAVLRKYNGGRLEDHEELRAITGKLTIGSATIHTSGPSAVTLTVRWTWDHCPIVTARDVFAIAWRPTFGTQNGNLRLNTSKSKHEVWYNMLGRISRIENFPIKNVDPCATAKSEFPVPGHLEEWAYHGELILYFERTTGSANLTEVDFVFSYGHTCIGASPSVSFDSTGAGIGISFGWNTSEACTRSGYVTIGDYWWHDN